jgi:hypothetical protein
MLAPLLGAPIASTAFAVALLASGQSSTITGTLAGQIVMEGFLKIRIRPWLRRLITRLLAIVPAIVLIGASGGKNTVGLLVFSQVVLSMQLSFAIFPLMSFTSDPKLMGEFANSRTVKIFGHADVHDRVNLYLFTRLSAGVGWRSSWPRRPRSRSVRFFYRGTDDAENLVALENSATDEAISPTPSVARLMKSEAGARPRGRRWPRAISIAQLAGPRR